MHSEQPGRLAARLLADDPDIKPRHFGDVMSTGKLLSIISTDHKVGIIGICRVSL
jgi:hypothetical protein